MSQVVVSTTPMTAIVFVFAIYFILDDNDLEQSTTSALLSWEYLNYFSSQPVTPVTSVTITDGLQFGDKLGTTQTSEITNAPPQPQPVFHPDPSDFHVYGVSETTESGQEMSPEFERDMETII